MVVIRKFKVMVIRPSVSEGIFKPNSIYPVIAIDAEDPGDISLLVVDDTSELTWVSWNEVKIVDVEE